MRFSCGASSNHHSYRKCLVHADLTGRDTFCVYFSHSPEEVMRESGTNPRSRLPSVLSM